MGGRGYEEEKEEGCGYKEEEEGGLRWFVEGV